LNLNKKEHPSSAFCFIILSDKYLIVIGGLVAGNGFACALWLPNWGGTRVCGRILFGGYHEGLQGPFNVIK
jgi:hypothetical protein